MSVEKSFKSFCNKLGGSFSKQETEHVENYFCQLTEPLTVDALLFGRKADENKYKIFSVHFGRKKVLELNDKDISKLEVRVEDIDPLFVQGVFTDVDQYVTYTTREDVQLYGIEMGCNKETNECKISFITE